MSIKNHTVKLGEIDRGHHIIIVTYEILPFSQLLLIDDHKNKKRKSL
jgi:hypothetical protein